LVWVESKPTYTEHNNPMFEKEKRRLSKVRDELKEQILTTDQKSKVHSMMLIEQLEAIEYKKIYGKRMEAIWGCRFWTFFICLLSTIAFIVLYQYGGGGGFTFSILFVGFCAWLVHRLYQAINHEKELIRYIDKRINVIKSELKFGYDTNEIDYEITESIPELLEEKRKRYMAKKSEPMDRVIANLGTGPDRYDILGEFKMLAVAQGFDDDWIESVAKEASQGDFFHYLLTLDSYMDPGNVFTRRCDIYKPFK